ncbi:MAG TPA: phosphotransferase, partial [Solirubrobacteraceae bacterium]
MPTLIRGPLQIDSAWLCEALERERLELLSSEEIGTGQMSQNHRLTFRADGGQEETVVVKLASEDPMSRATGVGMGAYMREVAFYRNLAGRIGGPLATCHLAEYDQGEGWFTIVLEDVRDAVQGDQIAGCGVAEARVAMGALARLHAPVMGDLAVGASGFLNLPNPLDQSLVSQLLPGFLERYRERIEPAHAAVCERFVQSIDGWASERRPPLGLVHGDYRLDNLLLGPGGRCVAVDWQTVSWGPAMVDASYFLGGCLHVEDRRASEQELLRHYHDTLLELGVRELPWELCFEEYRRLCFHGLLMTIAASMVVERTPRGDDMFMAWLARNAQ